MMPSIANQNKNTVINLRVTANSVQGHRKYMEDCYKIRFQREKFQNTGNKNDTGDPSSDIMFSYFGIFDGHGGKEASQFAKEKLYWKIVELDDFWSDDDSKVLSAIRNGFVQCHMEMWNELSTWPKTASGLPSTSGSTATILFIKKSKAYVGHVGDSGLVIGYVKNAQDEFNGSRAQWVGKKLTRDHKPEDPIELKRIQNCGGSVMAKSGIQRVVWNRPVIPHNHNTRKNSLNTTSSTGQMNSNNNLDGRNFQTEKVPFLAVARSLGDLWSYDRHHDEFIVSPVPDVFCFEINPSIHKCLILATDGLWNVMRATECVEMVKQTDKETETLAMKSSASSTAIHNSTVLNQTTVQPFINPSQRLVQTAIQRCCEKMIRADNTTCITIMIDEPPGDLREQYPIKSSNKKLEQLMLNKTNDISQLQDDYLNEITIINENPNDCTKLTKTFSNSLDDINSEFTTPISDDKRSKSLISLRRRHWSASSSRSASSNFIANKSTNVKSKFVNNDDRNKKRIFTNNGSSNRNNKSALNNSISMPTLTDDDQSQPTKIYKYKLKENVSSNDYRTRQNTLYNKGNSTALNLNSTTRSINLRKRSTNNHQPAKKSLNTSVSAIIGVNKISKSLRKSLNEIYTPSVEQKLNKNKARVKNNNEDAKENDEKSKTNRYVKRLKCFKDRLIQTKNNLLNRKRKLFETNTKEALFNNTTVGNKSVAGTRKSKSQYDFSDYQKNNKTFQNLYGNYRDNCEYDEDDLGENDEDLNGDEDDYEEENYYDQPTFDDKDNNKDQVTRNFKENQSFVEQFKSKLSYIKKGRGSSKNVNNLTCNGNLMMDAKNDLTFQSKRPKFY